METVFGPSYIAPKRKERETSFLSFGYGALKDYRPRAHKWDRMMTGISFEPVATDTDRALNDSAAVSGMCPLCNRKDHKHIDQYLIRNISDSKAVASFAKKHRIRVNTVLLHFARHILPIYSPIFDKAFSLKKAPDGWKPPEDLIDAIEDIRATTLTAPPGCTKVIPWVEIKKPKGNLEYAKHNVRSPWTKERIMDEIAERQNEAFNFFDEMVALKRMFRNIHDEIMSSTQEDRVTSDGANSTSYAQKNYGAAIRAVEGERGILTDLMKFSLIKASLEDSKDGSRSFSPAVASALDSIIGKRKPEQVEKQDIEKVLEDADIGTTNDVEYEVVQ